MEAISDFLLYMADKFPIVSFVLTFLAVLVVVCSAVVKMFPAVDKNGYLAKIIKFCDFLSIFYPKWKTESTDDAGQTD